MNDMVNLVEATARVGLEEVDAYFRMEPKDAADSGDRVDRALKVLSAYSRVRATRANEMAITVKVAEMLKLSGNDLAPIWKELTGADAKIIAAPQISEQSNDVASETKENSGSR